MAQVPKFGNWENEEDVPYTVYFEKAKKARKTKQQFPVPSSSNEHPFQDPEEAEIKHGDSTQSEPERRNASRTKEESRVSQEEVDMKKSSDSLPNPRRTSRQSGGGSDRSFDTSPLHSHIPPARSGNRGNTGSSPMPERKVSSEANHGPASSTPGRSRMKQVSRGDETDDDGTAIPKFGGWDEKDPASAEGYTHIFNKAREDRHNGGGKSPMVSTDDVNFYGQNQHGNENSKGCGCFPWSRK